MREVQVHTPTRIRTTFRLPSTLHEAIREESFRTRRDMTDIIVEQLLSRYQTGVTDGGDIPTITTNQPEKSCEEISA